MAMLVKGGTIVTATEKTKGDILIDGEKIVAIGTGLDSRAETIIDATGKYVFPGGIDAHTHFRLPFMGTHTRSFDTTPAALVGGTTCIVDFSPQFQGMSLMDSIVKHRQESAEGVSAVDFAFHAMVLDPSPSIFEEPPALVKAGIPTVKLFMAYKGTSFYSNDATIFNMLQATKKVGMLTAVHAENADVIYEWQQQLLAAGKTDPKYHAVSRPEVVEEEATYRATRLAKAADAPIFVVHISCIEAMEALRDARQAGIAAYGETCPHYMTLSVDNLSKPDFEGAKYVCSPALRDARHFDTMWASIQNGWLQTVGSDHCGFNLKDQKEMGKEDFTQIPNGCPGVQDRLHILYTYGVKTGKLSINRLVDVFATAPAKINGLYPRKGSLIVGADADIVVFDPKYKGTITVEDSYHEIDFNSYEGMKQVGRADKVYIRGHLVAEQGKYVAGDGFGQFIPGKPFGAAYD